MELNEIKPKTRIVFNMNSEPYSHGIIQRVREKSCTVAWYWFDGKFSHNNEQLISEMFELFKVDKVYYRNKIIGDILK